MTFEEEKSSESFYFWFW